MKVRGFGGDNTAFIGFEILECLQVQFRTVLKRGCLHFLFILSFLLLLLYQDKSKENICRTT